MPVAVEVRGTALTWTPGAEQQGQIEGSDVARAIEISGAAACVKCTVAVRIEQWIQQHLFHVEYTVVVAVGRRTIEDAQERREVAHVKGAAAVEVHHLAAGSERHGVATREDNKVVDVTIAVMVAVAELVGRIKRPGLTGQQVVECAGRSTGPHDDYFIHRGRTTQAEVLDQLVLVLVIAACDDLAYLPVGTGANIDIGADRITRRPLADHVELGPAARLAFVIDEQPNLFETILQKKIEIAVVVDVRRGQRVGVAADIHIHLRADLVAGPGSVVIEQHIRCVAVADIQVQRAAVVVIEEHGAPTRLKHRNAGLGRALAEGAVTLIEQEGVA